MRGIYSLLITIVLLSTSLIVQAAGPIPPSSLPGGAAFQDSDPGNGESWGRTNGRDWQFSNISLSYFNSLTWSAVDASSVGIAFDGTINTGTAEELSLSSVNGNQAIWTGSTKVLIVTSGSYVSVDTRFVMTLSSGGVPLNFQVNSMSGLPYVDLFAANGQFTVNLKMLAKLSSSTAWEPALDLFDRLDTDPTGDGLALTSFRSGFFYELAGAGLSIEEHDANMVEKGNQIRGDIDYLKGETVGRLIQLLDDTNNIERLVRDLQQSNQDNGTPPPTADEIRAIVSERLQEITNILIYLWGVDTSSGQPDPSSVVPITDLATKEQLQTLAAQLQALEQQLVQVDAKIVPPIEPRVLELEVLNSTRKAKHKKRMLLLSKENGDTVDVEVLSIKAIHTHHKGATTISDVGFSVIPVAAGLSEVELQLPHKNHFNGTYIIRVQHQDADGKIHYQNALLRGDAGDS